MNCSSSHTAWREIEYLNGERKGSHRGLVHLGNEIPMVELNMFVYQERSILTEDEDIAVKVVVVIMKVKDVIEKVEQEARKDEEKGET